MEEQNRTEHSARNTSVALIARALAILMGFLSRVVFTHVLSEEYVGINGLFTDILNVLALSELGVGTAITFALYRPISEKNIEKQKSLMLLYRRFYHYVAIFVFVAGILVIPFMDILIKDKPQVEHLTMIYLLYLLNTVVSYMWVYKKALVDAHQMNYLGVLYQTGSWVIQNLLQIIVLLTTRNFLLYVSMMVLCTLGSNLCISRKADRLFPYLKDKHIEPMDPAEKKSIFQSIRAMLMHKVGNVVVNNTDNLLLSALVGTVSVGCYSNYFLVIGSVRQVLEQVFQGIAASVGNLGVEEERDKISDIFHATFFLGQWVYGLCTICLFEVLNLFIGQSFGPQFVFSASITLVLCLNFYFTGMRQATLIFRDSMGLFCYDKYKAVAEAVINLVFSIVLGRKLGTIGVFLGTLISTITTSFWVEPFVLFRYRLKRSSKPYFFKYLYYTMMTFVLWLLETRICERITGNPWVVCIVRGFICLVLTNVAYFLIYHRTKEFRLLWSKGRYILKRKWKGFRKGE